MEAPAEISMDGYSEPSDDEKGRYYHGLAGQPRLVARTSTSAWTPYLDGWPTRKAWAIVGDHPLVQKWCAALRSAIVSTLQDSGLPWEAFFPIRIGDVLDGPMDRDVVLLVLLRPLSACSWQAALRLALRIRSLLFDYDIGTVQVECMESRIVPTASSVSAELDAKVDWTFSQVVPPELVERDVNMAKINETIMPLLPYPGHPIEQDAQPGNTDARIGTMGPFLRLGGDPAAKADSTTAVPESGIFALTSRHVVVGERVPIAHDVREDGKHEALGVLSGGIPYIGQSSVELKDAVCALRHEFRTTEMKFFRNPELNEMAHKTQKACLQYAANLEEELDHLEDTFSTTRRTIGAVAYSPRHTVERHGMFRDWALISTQEGVWAAQNKVYMAGQKTKDAIRDAVVWHAREKHNRYAFDEVPLDADGFVSLHVRDLPADPPFLEEARAAHLVAKRGQRTGLTFGLTNNIEAVRRAPFTAKQQNEPGEKDPIVSLHLLVLGRQGGFFTKGGDSGSCVFDCTGRVMGIVDGGADVGVKKTEGDDKTKEDAKAPAPPRHDTAGKGLLDVAFVTPIQWILDDIREFTGREVHIL